MFPVNNGQQQFQTYEITGNNDCDKLLPTNQIKSKYDFYKITIFEFSLTEELLDDIEFIVQLTTALPLALPLETFVPSEHLHVHSILTTIESINNRIGTDIAFTNFGSFFPVNNISQARDDLIHKVILIKDLQDIVDHHLNYRGEEVQITPAEKELLLQRGYVYASKVGNLQQRVKLVLDPVQELQVTDIPRLKKDKKIRIGNIYRAVDVSDEQLANILNGAGGFGIIDNRSVWLTKKSVVNLPKKNSRALSSPASNISFSISATHGIHINPDYLTEIDQSTFCAFLKAGLADKRAPEDLKILSENIDPDSAAYFANLNDSSFHSLLQIMVDHPRAGECSVHELPAPQPDLPKYEIGVVSRYEQEWSLLGYSKGALISSINLAPREEMQIEIFTWDKHKLEQQKEFGTEYEFNREINNLAKADTTITRDMKDSLNAHANADLNINIPTNKVSGGGKAQAGGAWATEEQLATDVNLISESSVKSAEKYKTTHRVKIVEAHEYGGENRTIRKIQNPNASRTLTFNYFEILENYLVTTQLKDASQFCILVENPKFPAFDLDFVMAYEYRLQQVLLSPNYKGGFDAARILAAQRWFDEQSAIEESVNRPDVGPTAKAPEGNENGSSSSNEYAPVTGIFATAQTIAEILEKEFLQLDIQQSLITLSKHHNPLDTTNYSQKTIEDARADISKYCFWIKLTNIYPGFDQNARSFVKKTAGKFGKKEAEKIIINSLTALVDQFDDDWMYAVKMFAASTVLQGIMKLPFLITGPFAPIIMGILEPVILPLAYNSDDRGLSKAISAAKKNIMPIVDTQNAVIAHQQVEMPGAAFEQSPAMPMQVPQLYSYRELAEAHADFTKLLTHLEKHRTYYSNEIWRVENEEERYSRLELLGIARFVENRLIGFAGKKAIYPLIETALPESFNLDPFRQDIDQRLKPEQKVKTELISVPTVGVHMDTLLGQCDALELYLQERREIERTLAQAQADLAIEKVRQQVLESQRLEKRLEKEILDNPYHDEN